MFNWFCQVLCNWGALKAIEGCGQARKDLHGLGGDGGSFGSVLGTGPGTKRVG